MALSDDLPLALGLEVIHNFGTLLRLDDYLDSLRPPLLLRGPLKNGLLLVELVPDDTTHHVIDVLRNIFYLLAHYGTENVALRRTL